MKKYLFRSVMPLMAVTLPLHGGVKIDPASWTAALNAPAISEPSSTGVIWGDGSNGADNTAIFASVDGDSVAMGHQDVALGLGQTLAVSGSIQLSGLTISASSRDQFRFGLFNTAGATGTTGWLGFLLSNSDSNETGFIRQRVNPNSGEFYSSTGASNVTTVASTNGSTQNSARDLTDGFYQMNLLIQRTDAGVEVTSSLLRSDGANFASKASHPVSPAADFGFNRIGFLSGANLDVDQITISDLSLTLTSASIVPTSWAVGLDNAGSVALTSKSSTGVVWGDGSSNDADNTAIHASLDADASTTLEDEITLADGESVALTGLVNFQSSISDTTGNIQFRWGMFNHHGSANAAGWTGYWAGNGTLGNSGAFFQSNSTSTLYVSSNTAGGGNIGTTTNSAGTTNIAAGPHRISMILTRAGSSLKFSASMRRVSDGAVLADIEGMDANPNVYTSFTRVGLLAGNGLDADQLTLSNFSVVYPYELPPEAPLPPIPSGTAEIAPDGVWTWFNDESAIWHLGKLHAGYVNRSGGVGIARFDPSTGMATQTVLSEAISTQIDDHNNPSITVLSDNRLLAIYSKHSATSQFYTRTSLHSQPSNLADWGPEQVVTTPAANSYSNTFRLTAEGNKIYHFSRCINYNPSLFLSQDSGATWAAPVHFIQTGTGSIRPYVRYCSNNSDRVDLLYTDGHPRNSDNSIYHLYYRAGEVRKTDGTLIDTFANLPLEHDAGQRGSVVYQYDPAKGRGWTWDVQYGEGGRPVCAYQTQRDDVTGTGWDQDRIYYHYARWTGTDWQSTLIAQGGRGLYSGEDDYGGGMCLDPEDPRVVYISTNAANPFVTGDLNNVPLASNSRYEIWRGFTADGGLTFSWTAITQNSPLDNLRPIVPANHGRSQNPLWFFGTYTSYTNYNTRVVGWFGDEMEQIEEWHDSNNLPGGTTGDSDNDGLSDFAEYALGGDPMNPADRPAPALAGSNYTFRHMPLRQDAEILVQTSPDLINWSVVATVRAGDLPDSVQSGLTLSGVTAGSLETMTLSPAPAAGFDRAFVRLKIQTPPLPQ